MSLWFREENRNEFFSTFLSSFRTELKNESNQRRTISSIEFLIWGIASNCSVNITEKQKWFLIRLVFFFYEENVEFCLFSDENERIEEIKDQRRKIEKLNENLREKIRTKTKKVDEENFREVEEQNHLTFVHRKLVERLKCVEENQARRLKISKKKSSTNENDRMLNERLRQIEQRLTTVRLIHRTLFQCKENLQNVRNSKRIS